MTDESDRLTKGCAFPERDEQLCGLMARKAGRRFVEQQDVLVASLVLQGSRDRHQCLLRRAQGADKVLGAGTDAVLLQQTFNREVQLSPADASAGSSRETALEGEVLGDRDVIEEP